MRSGGSFRSRPVAGSCSDTGERLLGLASVEFGSAVCGD
jgi:hypothetical protein